MNKSPHSSSPESTAGPPRRNLLTAFLAVLFSGIAGIIPFGAGLVMFLDPVLKKRATGGDQAGGEKAGHGGNDRPFLRVASLDALPADGTPVQVPVLADLSDAWNREVNQPIGAVYLSRQGDNVKCFNAICPHAGCFVAYSGDRDVFQCPCHTSAFKTDGSRMLPSPSPRDMDALEVKLVDGTVFVQFVNYYPGKETREAKA
jgi:menaquinol-cytochrome c reductase iron-sulfur subunit